MDRKEKHWFRRCKPMENLPILLVVSPYYSNPSVHCLSPCSVTNQFTNQIDEHGLILLQTQRWFPPSSCKWDVGFGQWSLSSNKLLIEQVLFAKCCYKLSWHDPRNNLKSPKFIVSQRQSQVVGSRWERALERVPGLTPRPQDSATSQLPWMVG